MYVSVGESVFVALFAGSQPVTRVMPQIEEKKEVGADRVDWFVPMPILTSDLIPIFLIYIPKNSSFVIGNLSILIYLINTVV